MSEIKPALAVYKAEMLSPLSSGDCYLPFAVSHEQTQLPAPSQGLSGCCSGFWASDPGGAHASLLCPFSLSSF